MIVVWNRCRRIGAGRRRVARKRPVALACLIVSLAGLAEARAGTEGGYYPDARNETCALGAPATYAPRVTGEAGAEIPVWKTITLGSHESADALRAALRAAHCGVGDLADQVLRLPDFTVEASRSEASLVVLTPADLGFGAEGASRVEIYRRARALGFALCPAETGPQLRLQYPDQPPGEFLRIAMAPLTTGDGARVSLSVGNGGAGLILIGRDVRPNALVPPTARFVFVRQDFSVTSLREGSGSLDGTVDSDLSGNKRSQFSR